MAERGGLVILKFAQPAPNKATALKIAMVNANCDEAAGRSLRASIMGRPFCKSYATGQGAHSMRAASAPPW